MLLVRFCFAVLLWIVYGTGIAQPVFIPHGDGVAPIPTVLWRREAAIATLIFVPGGNGSFGITQKTDPPPPWVLKTLASSERLKLNLVILDSPVSLQGDSGSPWIRLAPRRDPHHISVLNTTINHYRQALGQPVYLIGHSNGSISLAEWLKTQTDSSPLVQGLIFSGSRNETEISRELNRPVLVMHHRDDPNRWTLPSQAERLFEKLRRNNPSTTHFSWVTEGSDVPGGDPTHTGRHMYNGALDEAARLIEDFVLQTLR